VLLKQTSATNYADYNVTYPVPIIKRDSAAVVDRERDGIEKVLRSVGEKGSSTKGTRRGSRRRRRRRAGRRCSHPHLANVVRGFLRRVRMAYNRVIKQVSTQEQNHEECV
jgi:hypothetical protein